MHVAIRSTLTAGFALASAGAIAVSPISPVPSSLGDVTVSPSHSSSAPVALTALGELLENPGQSDPVAVWAEVLGTTIANVAQIADDMSTNPMPVLNQIIANQASYGQLLVTSLQAAADSYTQFFTSDDDYRFKYFARQAADYLAAGNVTDAAAVLKEIVFRLFAFANPLIGILQIPISMSQNAVKAFAAVPDMLMPLGLGALNPVEGLIDASGDMAQNVLDAVNAGDAAGTVKALANIPAVVTGALLNGYLHETGGGTSGLLMWGKAEFNRGLVQTLLVTVPQTIAKAIGWQGPSAQQVPTVAPVDNPTAVSAVATDASTNSPSVKRDALTARVSGLPAADHVTGSRITDSITAAAKTVALSVAPQRQTADTQTAGTPTTNGSGEVATVANSAAESATASDTADTKNSPVKRKATTAAKRMAGSARDVVKPRPDTKQQAKTRTGAKHRSGGDHSG
ncbi:hypothetical protein A5792_22385 [Mycolicibacterium peregrinum]|uniref:PE-PGRS family protein n=1 Tax=Mycolicibacterium peregrinum TaxID=43304 RepID=A0A1A0R4H8_MYCPR|nr:hypothetical protein [Mycolicibacterium peregrinum]OBB28669.1 hypothetical protein A5792_22385 [Mycolicibacterium peregrinum]